MDVPLHTGDKHSVHTAELCVAGIHARAAARLWASLNGPDVKSTNEDPCPRRMPANASMCAGGAGGSQAAGLPVTDYSCG